MKTLHTPGDWYAKDGQIVAQNTGKTLALIPYYDEADEEQSANANLMAAAPELLEALMMMVGKSNYPKDPKFNGSLTIANEVIQKATNP